MIGFVSGVAHKRLSGKRDKRHQTDLRTSSNDDLDFVIEKSVLNRLVLEVSTWL